MHYQKEPAKKVIKGQPPVTRHSNYCNTKELGQILGVKGESIRRSLSVNGHYMGLKPIKLPNGRLAWDESKAHNLFNELPNRK